MTLFNFLLSNTIRKKSMWFGFLIFLFSFATFIIFLPLFSKFDTYKLWANTFMPVSQSFLCISIAICTSIIAINIFNEMNENGTELIISSKPLTKFNITIIKFILFLFYCIILNLLSIIIGTFTAFFAKTEMQFYNSFLISLMIGNFIAFGIYGTIAILLSAKLVRIGVIIMNFVISLILFVYQCISLFAFPIPFVALQQNGMSASSCLVLNCQKDADGNFIGCEEKEIVKFTPTDLTNIKSYTNDIGTWQQMQYFWDDTIKSKDPSTFLNISDIASQISFTYMSHGFEDYTQREDKRNFSSSRFYDYKLIEPASPEICLDNRINNDFNWIYTGYNSYFFEYQDDQQRSTLLELCYPQSFGFAGILLANYSRVFDNTYSDNIPIGYISHKKSHTTKYVYFDKNEFNLYKNCFDDIYKTVYDKTNYGDDISKVNAIDLSTLWCSNNKNLNEYYKLVWKKLILNKDVLNIYTISDLNVRFIQYKYFAYLRALEEQHNLIYSDDECIDEEKIAKNLINSDDELPFIPISIKKLLREILDVEYIDGSWLMKCSDYDQSEFQLLPQNTKTIAYDWICKTEQVLEYNKLSSDKIEKSTLSKIKKTTSIFNYTCSTNEKFLYHSLCVDDEDSCRSSEYSGKLYTINDSWLPNINDPNVRQWMFPNIDKSIPIGQNIQYFFYETIPRVKYWWFSAIWVVICTGLFFSAFIVYIKYDIK